MFLVGLAIALTAAAVALASLLAAVGQANIDLNAILGAAVLLMGTVSLGVLALRREGPDQSEQPEP